MIRTRTRLIALLAATLAMAVAIGCSAQEQPPPPRVVGPAGGVAIARGLLQQAVARYGHRADLTLGMQIVMGGNCREAATCFACVTCHGVRGSGNAGSATPRLTGQGDLYLESALRSFAAGRRASATMQPVAKQLTAEQMRAVAEWYAAQVPAVALPLPGSPPQQTELARGGKIAAIGSTKARVQGCINCHGPAGSGEPPVFPYLAGQYPRYLEQQLAAFKQGTRRDPLHIMQSIAGQLDQADAAAVAQYFGSMQPPIHLRQVTLEERTRGTALRESSSTIIGGDPPPGPPGQRRQSDPPAPAGTGGTHGNPHAGPAEGRLIAFGGQFGQLKYSCASCHQLDGTGDPSGAFPRLARQNAGYLYQSLRDFASGARQSAVMQPIAQELSDEQMHSVAAFYAALRPQPYPPALPPDEVAITRGRMVATRGTSPGTAACTSCHGPKGKGARNAFPYLAGQYAPYLEQQLQLFKSRRRRGPQAIIMRTVASGLSDEQMHDVALYFASLRPSHMATAGLQPETTPDCESGHQPCSPVRMPSIGSGSGDRPRASSH